MGTETDTTETETDTQGGETDTEGDEEDTDAGMPTHQGRDTDEEDTDAHMTTNPSTDTSDGDEGMEGDQTPDKGQQTDGVTSTTDQNGEDKGEDEDAGQPGSEGTDHNRTGTEGDAAGSSNEEQEGEDNRSVPDRTEGAATHNINTDEGDDDPDESVDQGGNTDEEGDNNTDAEGGNAEGAGGTDSTAPEPDAGAAIDGPNPMPMPQPQPNSPGSVTINGTATEDETLTATVTDADTLPDATNIGYQWQHDTGADSAFENIDNANSPTYTLGDTDVDQTLRVLVNYIDGNDTMEALTSAPTTTVTNINDDPTGSVTITGTVEEDQILTANTGTLDDADGLGALSYQWQRNTGANGGFENIENATGETYTLVDADGTFADIGDATEQTYTLGDEDVGQRLQVVVSYTDNNGADETLSAATISAAASNADDPMIDEANTQTGTAGNDSLTAGAGSQRLNGLGGADFLQGGAGADILDGGDGTDRVSYSSDSADMEINLETGTATGGTAEGDVLISLCPSPIVSGDWRSGLTLV